MLQPGVSAPDISLPGLDGSAWNLREALLHGPVVLAFFKISCPTC
jgi:peroxiredoxin